PAGGRAADARYRGSAGGQPRIRAGRRRPRRRGDSRPRREGAGVSLHASSSATKPAPEDGGGVRDEVQALRRYLDSLAHASDDALAARYELKRPPMPPGLYWKARWLAGRILRSLRSISIWRPDPWPVALKHAGFRAGARPLVIWAVGADREDVRIACRRVA